jgi:hypothetical protein
MQYIITQFYFTHINYVFHFHFVQYFQVKQATSRKHFWNIIFLNPHSLNLTTKNEVLLKMYALLREDDACLLLVPNVKIAVTDVLTS